MSRQRGERLGQEDEGRPVQNQPRSRALRRGPRRGPARDAVHGRRQAVPLDHLRGDDGTARVHSQGRDGNWNISNTRTSNAADPGDEDMKRVKWLVDKNAWTLKYIAVVLTLGLIVEVTDFKL